MIPSQPPTHLSQSTCPRQPISTATLTNTCSTCIQTSIIWETTIVRAMHFEYKALWIVLCLTGATWINLPGLLLKPGHHLLIWPPHIRLWVVPVIDSGFQVTHLGNLLLLVSIMGTRLPVIPPNLLSSLQSWLDLLTLYGIFKILSAISTTAKTYPFITVPHRTINSQRLILIQAQTTVHGNVLALSYIAVN